jgi:hypothetical protein
MVFIIFYVFSPDFSLIFLVLHVNLPWVTYGPRNRLAKKLKRIKPLNSLCEFGAYR